MKTPTFDRILGDGDCYLFRAGKAAEHPLYQIVSLDDPDDVVASSSDKGKLKQMLDDELDPASYEIVGTIEPEPWRNARSNLKSIIKTAENNIDCNVHTIYLSDPSGDSFRKALDPQYKAHRDPDGKPFWYQELRHFLMENYHCVEAHRGMEADDLIGIEQCRSKDLTITSSVDKDFRQIPGWHYNLLHQEIFHMSEYDADMWLWEQMLIGDVADNIKGIHGIGEVKAAKLLKGKSIPEAEQIVSDLYAQKKGDDWEDIFHTNRQLLTILRKG